MYFQEQKAHADCVSIVYSYSLRENFRIDTNANIVRDYCVSVGVAEQACVLAYFDGNVDGEL